jgi:hypothetical protein
LFALWTSDMKQTCKCEVIAHVCPSAGCVAV